MSNPTSFEAIRRSLDGAAISTYILSMVILPAKYWCRLQNGRRNLGLDDALILVAAIMSNGFFFDAMIGEQGDPCASSNGSDPKTQVYGRSWESMPLNLTCRP